MYCNNIVYRILSLVFLSLPDRSYRNRTGNDLSSQATLLVMEAIRAKAISHFIDHTYPVIEEAMKLSRGHSTNLTNEEFCFHFRHIFMKRSKAGDKATVWASFLMSEVRLTVQHFIDLRYTATVYLALLV